MKIFSKSESSANLNVFLRNNTNRLPVDSKAPLPTKAAAYIGRASHDIMKWLVGHPQLESGTSAKRNLGQVLEIKVKQYGIPGVASRKSDSIPQDANGRAIPDLAPELLALVPAPHVRTSPAEHAAAWMSKQFPQLQDAKHLQPFISHVLEQSNVPPGVVYYALALMRRVPEQQRTSYSAQTLFLGALVVAAKSTNDSSPKNRHWARYVEFTTEEVNEVERRFLGDLSFSTRVEAPQLEAVMPPLIDAVDYHALLNATSTKIDLECLDGVIRQFTRSSEAITADDGRGHSVDIARRTDAGWAARPIVAKM